MSQPQMKFSNSAADCLSKAWYAVTSNLVPMLGFTVLYFIATSILNKIPVVNSFTSLFQFVYAVSLFSAFDTIEKGGNASLKDFFNWTPKFGKLFGAHLITVGIAIIVFIPLIIFIFTMVGGDMISTMWSSGWNIRRVGDVSGGFIAGSIILTLIGGILLTVGTFAFIFVVQFRELAVLDALRLSLKIGRENIGDIIVYLLLAIGVAILGVLALLVGVLVAIPLIFGMQYYLMRSLFPQEEIQQWDFMAKGNQEQ